MLIPRVSGKLPTYYTLAFRSLLPSTLLFTSLAFTTYRWRPSEPYAFYAIGKHGFQTGHGRYPFVCQAGGSNNEEGEGFRINKCFAAFASRREADKFVMYGRVKINGVVAQPGMRVRPGDKVWTRNRHFEMFKVYVLPKYRHFWGSICVTKAVPLNRVTKPLTSRSRHD